MRSHGSPFGDIWSSCLTPTISVFLWCFFHGRIPVDVMLYSHGISLASKWQCYVSPQIETSMNVAMLRESTRAIWAHFAEWFPAHTRLHTCIDIARSLVRWRQRFLCTLAHICLSWSLAWLFILSRRRGMIRSIVIFLIVSLTWSHRLLIACALWLMLDCFFPLTRLVAIRWWTSCLRLV